MSRKKNRFPSFLREKFYEFKSGVYDMPGYMVGVALGCVSGYIAIQVGNETGGNAEEKAIVIISAVSIQILIAVLPVYTIGRCRIIAALLASIIWVPCVLYSQSSSFTYLTQSFSNAGARQEKAYSDFERTKFDLQNLRDKRAKITFEGNAETINQQIQAILNQPGLYGQTFGERTQDCTKNIQRAIESCSKVNTLRISLKIAQGRDDLDQQIKDKISQLNTSKPIGKSNVEGLLAPVYSWIRQKTVFEVHNDKDFRSLLLWFVVEWGAMLIPLLMSICRRKPEQQSVLNGQVQDNNRSTSGAWTECNQNLRSGLSGSSETIFEEWLKKNVILSTGEYTASSELFKDIQEFAGGEVEAKSKGINRKSLSQYLVGMGFDKKKCGSNNTIHYYGLVMRKSVQNIPVVQTGSNGFRFIPASFRNAGTTLHGITL